MGGEYARGDNRPMFAPLANDIVCTPEADRRLVVCARKGTRVTFEIDAQRAFVRRAHQGQREIGLG